MIAAQARELAFELELLPFPLPRVIRGDARDRLLPLLGAELRIGIAPVVHEVGAEMLLGSELDQPRSAARPVPRAVYVQPARLVDAGEHHDRLLHGARR